MAAEGIKQMGDLLFYATLVGLVLSVCNAIALLISEWKEKE